MAEQSNSLSAFGKKLFFIFVHTYMYMYSFVQSSGKVMTLARWTFKSKHLIYRIVLNNFLQKHKYVIHYLLIIHI